MEPEPPARNPLIAFARSLYTVLDGPVTFFRETIIDPNHQKYPYYHQKFQRVPTIDECYTDDFVCRYEANNQYRRDKMVESEILSILRQRHEHCVHEDRNQRVEAKCNALYEAYLEASGAWFAKYGDLGYHANVVFAFMKQKHRMVWERRHGPVGSGMNPKFIDEFKVDEDDH